MIDIKDLHKYQENNRIEAKKAAGGLPNSIWETYSAFANTQGGIILLGVIENEDRSLDVFGVSKPEKMIKEFWDIINNKNKTSVNILSDRNVEILELDGKKIICINVPRALRCDKPVYIGGNPLNGSYRTNTPYGTIIFRIIVSLISCPRTCSKSQFSVTFPRQSSLRNKPLSYQ